MSARAALLVLAAAAAPTASAAPSAADASYRKAWLLHATSEPLVEGPAAGTSIGNGGTRHRNATLATLEASEGRLRVHTVLPREREVVARGGPGFEFWTPGDATGGGPDDGTLRVAWNVRQESRRRLRRLR